MASGESGADAGTASQQGRQPGHELAGARERRRIDRTAMAAKLHLPEAQLDALERDDYQQLPPPTFVRGYLRAYAREVELDGDDIVAAYDALGVAAEEPALRPVESSGRSGGSKATAASVLILVGVVVAAFFGWWWQNRTAQPTETGVAEVAQETGSAQGGGQTATPADGDDEAGDAAQGNGSAPSADTGESTASSGAEQPSANATPEPEGTTAATGNGGEANAEPDPGASASSPPSDRMATAAQSAAATADSSEGDSDGTSASTSGSDYDPPSATSSADEAVAPAATQGPDVLELEVAGRSWVEVYDARGRELVYTLYSGERPLRLRGWAPFDVFLGNSPDVRVRFDGRSVTKSAFTRSNQTARFLVDAQGARPR